MQDQNEHQNQHHSESLLEGGAPETAKDTGTPAERPDKPNKSTNKPDKKGRRVALAPHLKEIQQWVEQGRSDEWIATALGTSPNSIQSFRSRAGVRRLRRGGYTTPAGTSRDSSNTSNNPNTINISGITNTSNTYSTYEGVLEHGEEAGYGLWLDPAVADDPAFKRGFGGVRDVVVSVEEDRIVLKPVEDSDTGAGYTAGVEVPEAPQTASRGGDLPGALHEVFGSPPDPSRERGIVKWFEPDRGHGFIRRPSGEEIFVHKSEVRAGDSLHTGAEVSYEVGENQRGPVANAVKIVE